MNCRTLLLIAFVCYVLLYKIKKKELEYDGEMTDVLHEVPCTVSALVS